ncbi:MAG: Transcriptional regulatory protein SrrA [Firmicutes bacterium ADurb.Bin193]|nr:MAG: Transcriptional regulatory protein SrrA [Firmicutes bacterium ADurb.Bin193]
MSRTVLIVEDNKSIVDILTTYLLQASFSPVVATDGNDGLEKFNRYNPDIILLDIMMPKKDGYEVLKEIRRTLNVPIIMITAKTEEADRIMGLDYGADDYIVKPFSPKEVVARINAVLRRIQPSNVRSENVIVVDNLKIDLEEYKVEVNNTPINLSKKEIDILWFLASNPNRTFSRDSLLDKIWGIDYFGDMRTVDTHIKRLRAKLNIKSDYKWSLETIWGVGYKFEVK